MSATHDRRGEYAVAGFGRLYFAGQAIAGLAWWIMVFSSDAVRQMTLGELDPVGMAALDIPLFVVASGLVAVGIRSTVWVVVPWTLLVTLGMALYATVTGNAGWGALLMIAASLGNIIAGFLVRTGRLPTERIIVGPFAFRTARPSGRAG